MVDAEKGEKKMKKLEINGCERISKARARRIVSETSESVYIVPCKCVPGIGWYCTARINKKVLEINEYTFESFINEFIYYNCQYNQTGKYPAFYIKTK